MPKIIANYFQKLPGAWTRQGKRGKEIYYTPYPRLMVSPAADDDDPEAEVCMSLPPGASDFGSGLAFIESELEGGGVLGRGGSVAKSPVSKIDSFPSMGCPGTIT